MKTQNYNLKIPLFIFSRERFFKKRKKLIFNENFKTQIDLLNFKVL